MHRGFSPLVPSDYGYENNMPTHQQLLWCLHTAIVWQHVHIYSELCVSAYICVCVPVCVLCAPVVAGAAAHGFNPFPYTVYNPTLKKPTVYSVKPIAPL